MTEQFGHVRSISISRMHCQQGIPPASLQGIKTLATKIDKMFVSKV